MAIHLIRKDPSMKIDGTEYTLQGYWLVYCGDTFPPLWFGTIPEDKINLQTSELSADLNGNDMCIGSDEEIALKNRKAQLDIMQQIAKKQSVSSGKGTPILQDN